MNEDIKRRYIDSFKHPSSEVIVQKLKTVFSDIAPLEKQYGKDACSFTFTEILSFYKSLSSTSMNSLQVANERLAEYTDWCAENGIMKEGINNYRDVTIEVLGACIDTDYFDKAVITREDLLKKIHLFENSCDQFLVLGLFEGIEGVGLSDFWNLMPSDIHGDTVHLASGRDLTLSKELITIGRKSAKTYVYIADRGNGKPMSFKETDGRIIKAFWNNPEEETQISLRKRMNSKLVRLQKAFDFPFSRTALLESGRVDMIKRLHKSGETYKDTYFANRKKIDLYYGKIRSWAKWAAMYGNSLEK